MSNVASAVAFAAPPSQPKIFSRAVGPGGAAGRGLSGSVISTSTIGPSSMDASALARSSPEAPSPASPDGVVFFAAPAAPKSSLARIFLLFVPISPVASSLSDIRLVSARNSGSFFRTCASSASVSTFAGAAPAFVGGASAGMSMRCGQSISSLIQLLVASETAFLSHGTRFTSRPPPTRTSSAIAGGSGKESTIAPYPGSRRDSAAMSTRTVPLNLTSWMSTGTRARPSAGRPIAGTTSMPASMSLSHVTSTSNAMSFSPTS
mmetsp:Transcript_753/g.3095  ORF Transcript_753/g.3095 Transcript_753/m.3095 type:complete len:263 (+) Transcript_753:445-1233(+)